MKQKLIVAAVSAALAAPVVAQAEAEVTFYGRINNAIEFNDKDDVGTPSSGMMGQTGYVPASDNYKKGDSTTDISGVSSRFGVKASSDLGNGLTASLQYEFGTTTDNSDDGITSTRVAKVGIGGGFGKIEVGNQWSAFFNTVGTDIDPTYAVGGGLNNSPFRTGNTIKYSNGFGPVHFELDARVDDADDGQGDGYGVGFRVAATDQLTVAAAYDTADKGDRDEDLFGVSANLSLGQFFGILAWHEKDFDKAANKVTKDDGSAYVIAPPMNATAEQRIAAADDYAAAFADLNINDASTVQLWVGADVTDSTRIMLGYATAEQNRDGSIVTTVGMSESSDGAGDAVAEVTANPSTHDPSAFTIGIYHNMGGGLRLWFESISMDVDDEPNTSDSSKYLLGMRYDF